MDNNAHQATITFGTHAIVVRNTGKLSAKHVRLGHNILPNYNIYPSIEYKISSLENGSKEIYIPALVPGEQVMELPPLNRTTYLPFATLRN